VDSPRLLAHLRAEFDAYEAYLSGDLTAPVEHCGDWTLQDLTEHLGRSSLWAAVAVEEKRGDYSAPATRPSWCDGRASAPSRAIRLVATDTRSSWTYGPGTPVATISATAEKLLLMVGGRVPPNDEALEWSGDRDAGQAVLNGPLVP
jgi:MDMPI C-terminal domain/Mycothiol maleylpyruvate isomerase N-terminal domain